MDHVIVTHELPQNLPVMWLLTKQKSSKKSNNTILQEKKLPQLKIAWEFSVFCDDVRVVYLQNGLLSPKNVSKTVFYFS